MIGAKLKKMRICMYYKRLHEVLADIKKSLRLKRETYCFFDSFLSLVSRNQGLMVCNTILDIFRNSYRV